MYIGLHVNYPLCLSDFNETWISSADIREKKPPQMWNFMKIRPVGAKLFHAGVRACGPTDGRTDGQTDRHDEANSRFLQFSERAQKWREYLFWLRSISESQFSVTNVFRSSVYTDLHASKIFYYFSDNFIITPYVASKLDNLLQEFSCPRFLSVGNVLHVPPQGGKGREIWWPRRPSLWTKMSAK
jgi:hypothetical protein